MKILPPVLFILFALTMILLHILHLSPSLITGGVRLLGVPIFIAALTLSIFGSRLFKTRGANIQTFEEPTALVTDGPFRWTRNPMYLGFVLALLGIAIGLGSLIPFILVLVFLVICDHWYIAIEEKAMLLKFGTRYEAYQKQVRRWI